jgi:hypothetical protein
MERPVALLVIARVSLLPRWSCLRTRGWGGISRTARVTVPHVLPCTGRLLQGKAPWHLQAVHVRVASTDVGTLARATQCSATHANTQAGCLLLVLASVVLTVS